MSDHTRRTCLVVTAAAALLAVGLGDVGPAVARPITADPAVSRCHWSSAQLPRTPDAVEGWYRGCPSSHPPQTPRGVEGWSR